VVVFLESAGIADAAAAAKSIRAASELTDRPSAVAAVQRFAATRRAAALYNRGAAGLALRQMQARGAGTRAKLRVAVCVAQAGRRAGVWLDSAPYGPRARGAGYDRY